MIGRIVSHYKILEKLGEGGMGVVYKAEDTKLKRLVALKFLPPELTRDEDAKQRFIHEAQAASAIDHPNICSVYEIDQTPEGQLFISMAYYEGRTLKEKLTGALPINDAADIAVQLAEGLKKAHQKSVIHRDLKPANVMINEEGLVKIVDFGLAKFKAQSRLTRTGTTLGTVAYMSPEQGLGREIDARSDIWSLGVILYEMVTGKLPFSGDYDQAVLYAIINEEPGSISRLREDVPDDLKRIVRKAITKNPEDRYQTAAELLRDLKQFQKGISTPEARVLDSTRLLRLFRRPKIVIPVFLVICAILGSVFWCIHRQSRIRWARETLLPKIEELIMAEESGRDNRIDAYKLVQQAETYLSGNPKLSELASKCAVIFSIETDPPGARISMKKYSAPESEWEYLGVSPLKDIRLPMGIFRWKMEKEGCENVLAAAPTYKRDVSRQFFNIPDNLKRVLDKKGGLPSGMVRVSGGQIPDVGYIDDFWIDQFEVTNRQFREFIDQGGYQNKKYWKNPFIKDGKVLAWEMAVFEFMDQTGRPGPSTWQAGTFPKGQENHPVSGVSWYEAAAFAEFAGKSLPTSHHWGVARGERTSLGQYQSAFPSVLYPISNFQGEGPAPVGTYQGIAAYGTYDMAGNVREWCWNETPQGRVVRGGAWSDINYMYINLSQAPPFDRSTKNGFRCVRYVDPRNIPETAFQPVQFDQAPDYSQIKPVSDSVFQIYKDQFAYDKKDLNTQVESRDEKAENWIKEKVTFDTAYENERMTAYLFRPKNFRPPFQTVVYFPGSSATQQKSSQELEKYVWFEVDLTFLMQNGRAVLFPIYKGTFERVDPKFETRTRESRLSTEYYIHVIKEFKRCVDYLETRPDIDAGKIAYLGFSWGAFLGAVIPAVEERLKVSILKTGGLESGYRPEISPINYVTRVKLPTLMLNGRYDMIFPYETSAKPMYDLLGTPKEDKVLKLHDTDHFIPRNEFIKETLAWLDKYFGRPAR